MALNNLQIQQELARIAKKLGHFPSRSEIKKAGSRGLIGAVSRTGGSIYWRQKLGVPSHWHPTGYWTKETIIRTVMPLALRLKRCPSTKELLSHSRLTNRAYCMLLQYGDMKTLAQWLGFSAKFRGKNYWTREKVKQALLPLCEELGRFPTQMEVKARGGEIFAAFHSMYRFGGGWEIATEMGFENLKFPDGYWTMNRIISAILPIAEEVGRFPTRGELTKTKTGKKLIPRIILMGGVFRVASEIKRLVKNGRLPKKYYFASRLNRMIFSKLPRKMQKELAREDSYYRRMLG